MSLLRTYLPLSRAANLPGVWSNCLAGWWLGGGGRLRELFFLLLGATFLYAGAAALNDALDFDSDKDHRRTRPIVTGALSEKTVWRTGWIWLGLGLLLMMWAGATVRILGMVLFICIIIYNSVHRLLPASPALLGLCRLCLYLMGATTAEFGVTGWSVWCGLAMAAYVSGAGCFRRWERVTWSINFWPMLLLIVPVGMALVLNGPEYRAQAWELSAIVLLWIAMAMRATFWAPERNLALGVSRLQAGIILVDWLAVADATRPFSALFIGLFLITLALQRVVPE